MMVELAVYGLCTGLFYRRFPRKPVYLYVSLVLAMLLGRLCWGAVRWLFTCFGAGAFTFQAFLTGAFISAWPGIVCHLLVIPPLVMALKKGGVLKD